MPLFRKETQDARANAWLGKVLLTRPLSFALLTTASLVMVAAVGAFFVLGEYTRKARVTGVIAPVHGLVRIVAPQSGVVQNLEIAEGQQVTTGMAIVTLVDSRVAFEGHEGAGSSIAARLADRFHALVVQRDHVLAAMRAEQSMISRRRTALDREVALLEGELASQAKRAALARHSLERALDLSSSGFLSGAALDRERDAALDQESRVEAMRRARMAIVRDADSADLDAQSAFSRAQAQVASIDGQLAALEQERVERQLQYRATIVAPTSGSIATILVEPGQSITAGTIVATLIPRADALEAQLFAPSRSIGFVRTGQDVLLRFLAFPHQKFGMHQARITGISRNPMTPVELGFTPADGSREPLYRIKAELGAQSIEAYGKQEPLQVGMQVEADIRLDRRRLIEWIFEPLLSLSGRA